MLVDQLYPNFRSMDKECDEDIEKINETLLLFENFGTM